VVKVYPHTKLDGNPKNFLWTYGRTDGWTRLSSNLLGHRRGDDLKIGLVYAVVQVRYYHHQPSVFSSTQKRWRQT